MSKADKCSHEACISVEGGQTLKMFSVLKKNISGSEVRAFYLIQTGEEGRSEKLTLEQRQGGMRYMVICLRTFQVQEEHMHRPDLFENKQAGQCICNR